MENIVFILEHKKGFDFVVYFVCGAVQPVIKVPSQLMGAPFGHDLTLRCEIEAMPKVKNNQTKKNSTYRSEAL